MTRSFPGYEEPGALGPLPRRCEPVETLWTFRAEAPRDFLVLPDGRADLIVRFRVLPDGICDDAVPLLVGPSSRPHRVPVAAGDGFVGIRLRPGRLGWLRDAAGLADSRFGGDVAVERVPLLGGLPRGAPAFAAMAAAMRQLGRDLPEADPIPHIEAALDRIHLAGGRVAPGPLAAALGLGARRLHRLFVAHVGLPPQRYAAVIRFQRAVRLRLRGLTAAATAPEAGYADQPHMTRAFRRHGGFTPARMPAVALGMMPIEQGAGIHRRIPHETVSIEHASKHSCRQLISAMTSPRLPALPTFSSRLRFLRRARSVKQSDLAARLGVDQATLSRWESGSRKPDEDMARSALRILAAPQMSDAPLARLVATSHAAVHLIDDVTHRCIAASHARLAEWGVERTDVIGCTLWRHATPEIVTAEAALPDHGWWDVFDPSVPAFRTSGHEREGLTVVASLLQWDRLYLGDGTPVRLCSSVAAA